MTITNFKNMIYGFINRESSLFTTTQGGSTDQVLQAMNAVRRDAQRRYAFELNRVDCFLTTSLAGANWQTGCKTTPGGATAVLMRRIDTVWNYATSGSIYPRSSRIDLGHVNDYKRELPVYGGSVSGVTNPNQVPATQRPFAYVNGSTLYVTPYTTSTTFLLNGIKWQDDLTGSEDPDIFLTYFTDWFQWAVLSYLNLFLKDHERVAVDAAMVRELWESVKEYDGQFINAGDGAALD
jgi:hypothetical protein